MSDDSGSDSGSSGSWPSRSHSSPLSLGVIRRAMRWETFAVAALLVVLALVFG